MNNNEILYYELTGSRIDKMYQLWFNDLAMRVSTIMASDGINYKIRRRIRKNHKKWRRRQ